jgi:hypothetical protein
VTLYLVNARGKLQLLEQYPASDRDREIIYPGPGKTRTLQGPPGTEMILAVSGFDGPPFWESEPEPAAWPALPSNAVVHLQMDRVEVQEERSRDLGATRDRSDPQERIRQRLDELRERLQPKSSFFEGLAFGHE